MASNSRRQFQQQDPTKGNFRAYKNLSARQDNRQPAFTGNIALPGNPDEERSVSLWAARSRTNGSLILSGPVTPDRNTQWDNLAPPAGAPVEEPKYVTMKDGSKPFPVEANHMVLFTSPNTEAAEGKKVPPKMFGYFNPGGDQPLMVVSGFEHADRSNNIMLLGPVEKYDPERNYQKEMSSPSPEAGKDDDNPFDPEQEVPVHLQAQKKSGRHRHADDGPSR